MKKKTIKRIKKSIICLLCAISIFTATLGYVPIAYSQASSGILGTNVALGSPVLNNNFTIEDWNKWEIICWGVFLSNFCQPFIDDYQTAFKTGAGGTEGAGYKALCFGSGNDQVNNKTIESLCDYAIAQQKVSQKQIYVSWDKIEAGAVVDGTGDKEAATFKDFFFARKAADGQTWAQDSTTFTWYIRNIQNYSTISTLGYGTLPTFYIKDASNNFIEVFSFKNAWDVQLMAGLVNSVRDQCETQVEEAFESLWSSDSPVIMDSFGNILAGDKMLIPACVNQHLTQDDKVNLLNSWVMNGYNSTYSDDQLIQGLRQTIKSSVCWENACDTQGGWPALGQSNIGQVGLLYYDIESAVIDKATATTTNGTYKLDEFGEAMIALFESNIDNKTNKYPLKFEISGTDAHIEEWVGFTSGKNVLYDTTILASLVPNILKAETQPEMLYEIINTTGDKIPLFSSDAVIVANQVALSRPNQADKSGAIRAFYNFLYQVYTGEVTTTAYGSVTRDDVVAFLKQCHSYKDFIENLEDKESWWKSFQAHCPVYKDIECPTPEWYEELDILGFGAHNSSINENVARLIKVYPVSDVMRTVSQILCIDDNLVQSSFSTYSTMIYATYLDWYGVASKSTLSGSTEKVSNFDTAIFDENSDLLKMDPSEIIDAKSEEDLEKEILKMSYYMLHPEDGREYRKSLIFNGFNDFMYEQYNRIVYGGQSSIYSGSASKSDSGFLAIEKYSDNFFTAWFLNGYSTIAVWLITGLVLCIILVGLLKSKKLSWFILSMLLVVNTILIVPSSGEIVPYIAASFVQKIFSDKMTYWAISEGVTNATMEADAASQTGEMSELSETEAGQVVQLVKTLNVVYTDRSLMLKQDISQKVTQQVSSLYTDIQKLQSTRWMLPMLMQQFSGDDGTADYLYVKLSNVWDDCSNLYWYFWPSEADMVEKETATSNQNETATKADDSHMAETYKLERIPDGQKAEKKLADTDVNYMNFSYTTHGDTSELTHLYNYVLPELSVYNRKDVFGNKAENYKNADSWQDYIDAAVVAKYSDKGNWITNKNGGFESTSDSYLRTDRSTITPDMSYLRNTESPMYYFYCVIKDCFNDSSSTGSVIGSLQGEYVLDESGNEQRVNFMYGTRSIGLEDYEQDNITYSTGHVRDILDLQELFTNVVPYMYEMQLITGGFDGESGILTESDGNKLVPLLISDDLSYYEGERQSWMYRCNWATKLMENPEYSKPLKVKDSNGTEYTVNNPMLAESYPDNRPMVFSEAQMKAMGLNMGHLNLVEVKCVELNKEVAKKWTLLINYAGTEGITKEVLYRQMAADATFMFGANFSSGGVVNTIYQLYPQSLDLRYLSFDSVMKMLMLNVSKDTSYIYGDTMATVISSSDSTTAFLLLACAFICAFIIPLLRTALIALIFYLGYLAVLQNIFTSIKYKSQVACGQFISNILFLVYTLIYYGIFGALMAVTSSDEVLSVNRIEAKAGNPVWVLIIILIVSAIYIVLMWKQICFCVRNYRDMGIETYTAVASAVTSKIRSAINNVKDALGSIGNGDGAVASSSSSASIKGTGTRNKNNTQDVNIKQSSDSSITITKDTEDTEDKHEDIYTMHYNSDDGLDYTDDTTAYEIDAEIEAGKNMK